ncbi:arsenicals resistance [Naganishia albida]|nr:arsenicals resistance [Naganishia albida]
MIIGVIIGEFADGVQEAFSGASFRGVSIPIVIGLLVMMWPTLTKVQYEEFPQIFRQREIWRQIAVSLFLNWIVGPFVMLGIAYATLPDLPEYRTGVIMVGLARCIAMVSIWNQLAGGDHNYCAILVIINSILQIILYSPLSLLFINVIGGYEGTLDALELSYGDVAIAVLIYLGIPLAAGIVTRYTVMLLCGRKFFTSKFLPYFSPLALLGLLYTIIVIFAEQAKQILDNIGDVFRVFVPMIVYFSLMWTGTFVGVWWWLRRRNSRTQGESANKKGWAYKMAVVQAFTAGSNNFELSIAVCVAVYGVHSPQALAATIGPLVEVPVLLALTWVSIYLRTKLRWGDELFVEEGKDEAAGLDEKGPRKPGATDST